MMEQFKIKQEPYFSQEMDEFVNIDNNHSMIDEKPNYINSEYIDNNRSNIPICFEIYSKIKQELDFSYEEQPIFKVKSDDLEANIDNYSLKDEKPNKIKLDCSLLKLRNTTVVLERMSTVQILEYTKKREISESESIRLNVDAIKYVCKYTCLKCDSTVNIKSIRNIINCPPECECIPTIAYQCLRCNKHFLSYSGMQSHINNIGLCKSQKKILLLRGFNDDEWKKLNCPKCNVSLENIAQFTKHVNDCAEQPKFWCLHCDYGGNRIINFRRHLKLHDRKNKTTFICRTTICYCSVCDETLVSKGFRSYQVCNKCRTPYTYQCPTCKKEYRSLSNVRIHIDSKCDTAKNYRCFICKEKEFSTKCTLMKHLNYCGNARYMNCKFCSFKTKNNSTFNEHFKRYHAKERCFIDQDRDEDINYANPPYYLFCEQCNESKENGYDRKNGFYYCLKCKTKLLLQCQKCNAEYRAHSRIVTHIASNCGLKIKGEPKECHKCNRKFIRLREHMDYCRDSTVYCAHCSYSTKKKFSLKCHLFSIHKNEFNGEQEELHY